MAPESQILYLCGHVHRHQTIRLRDLNDAYALMTQVDFDVAWVEKQVQMALLGPIYQQLLSEAARIYPHCDELREALRSSRKAGMGHWVTRSMPILASRSAWRTLPVLLQAELSASRGHSVIERLSYSAGAIILLAEEAIFKKHDARRQAHLDWSVRLHDVLFPSDAPFYYKVLHSRRYAERIELDAGNVFPLQDVGLIAAQVKRPWRASRLDRYVWEIARKGREGALILTPVGFYVWLDYYMRPLIEVAQARLFVTELYQTINWDR
jgi:hypothetical protein